MPYWVHANNKTTQNPYFNLIRNLRCSHSQKFRIPLLRHHHHIFAPPSQFPAKPPAQEQPQVYHFTVRTSLRRSMALTNFILTVAGVGAVVLMLRSDVRQSASIFKRNVKHIRTWLEEESPKITKELESKVPPKDIPKDKH
ncbi:hypothetical protein DVH24_008319 [Malus domestica]|uniref:Uncharacterized protein n=1 Tax=Malus domestica TaxID=3750 RepID=A0A498JIU1_MALDO|nr:hypothetical protein DVH24_008319 [Malus domestica]